MNYLYRFPSHAVSIGVEVGGELTAGVVHDTALDVVFAAAKGHGATRNGEPISVGGTEDVAMTLLATGFGYESDVRRRQGMTLAAILPQVRDIRRAGSAAVDMCFAASGMVDAYYETGPHPWDVAAGVLIVREAGGTATYDPDARRVLASNSKLHPQLLEMVLAAETAD